MAGKSRRPPMSKEQMLEAAEATATSKVYAGRGQTAEVNRSTVTEIVAGMAREMEAAADESRRFPLSDLVKVDSVARQYVTVCAEAGVLPTVTGAAAAMGRTRTALYKFADDHRAFAEWLTEFSDRCGEAAAAAAIHGAAAAIPVIFLLKSRHGWKDVVAVEAVQPRRDSIYDADPEEIARKYADLPSD